MIITDIYNKPEKTSPLYQVCEEVEDFEKESYQIAALLESHIDDKRMLGLAANQIGILKRAFYMRGVVFFNPVVEPIGDEMVKMTEGCLSYPDLFIDIKRPRRVSMTYKNVDGEEYTKTFTEMSARIIQHEFDHLNGIPFFKRATRYHFDKAKKNLKKKA